MFNCNFVLGMNTIIKTNNNVVNLKKFLQQRVWWRKDFAIFVKSKLLDIWSQIWTIWDVWCGAWTVAMELARILPESAIYGLDINDHFWSADIDYTDNFQYINFEPYNLSKQKILFDVVLLWGVLHHIPKEDTDVFFADLNNSISDSWIIIVHEHRLSELKIRRYIELWQLALLETLNTKTLEWMHCSYNFYTKNNLIQTFDNYWYKLIESADTNWKFVTIPTINGNTVFIFKKKIVNR